MALTKYFYINYRYRHLRSEDRDMNSDVYPHLHFPEVYLLEGGYKAFFLTHVVSRAYVFPAIILL
ncbi:hypothetical protein DPMN_163122 [Dreissena polymorpha]|uniref:Uncharacterized protein n=1 Tax=Dreissena polymorpha TaxID=45954 RepID=A0A9D4ESM2_DREPO|nr:hypothetical protein DPMN_163122 [Dreissena polymorpha]